MSSFSKVGCVLSLATLSISMFDSTTSKLPQQGGVETYKTQITKDKHPTTPSGPPLDPEKILRMSKNEHFVEVLRHKGQPQKILQMYKSQHSAEVLRQELKTEGQPSEDRKFLLGRYCGPHRAGNFLHDFTTAMLLAVVTNRTLLFEYKCQSVEDSQFSVCNEIVQVNDWIPSWGEFRSSYHDQRLEREPIHLWGVTQNLHWNLEELYVARARYRVRNDGNLSSTDPFVRLVPFNVSRYYEQQPFIGLGILRKLTPERLLMLTEPFTYAFTMQLLGLEQHPPNQTIIEGLYSKGIWFLYGMLFRESFHFTDQLKASAADSFPQLNETTNGHTAISIGLHARHNKEEDDGSFVDEEVQCLDHLLNALRTDKSHSNQRMGCNVFIMSDRPASVIKLQEEVWKRNCSAIVSKKEGEEDAHEEQGPWTRAGFFHDVLLVSQARTGFAGRSRSSSHMVLELMVYDSFVDAQQRSTMDEATMVEPQPPLFCDMGP